MASLEDLLAEDGFKGGRMRSRSSFKAEAVNKPVRLLRQQSSSESSSRVRTKTHRTRSDVSRYSSRTEFETKEEARKRRSDLQTAKRVADESHDRVKEIEILEETDFQGFPETGRFNFKVSQGAGESWKNEERCGGDDLGEERVQDHFEDALPGPETEREAHGYHHGFEEEESLNESNSRDVQEIDESRSKYTKHLSSFRSNSSNHLHEPNSFSGGSSRLSQLTRKDGNSHRHKRADLDREAAEPALDEAAIQAMISILSGYINRYLKDEDFRKSLCCKCAESVGLSPSGDQVPYSSGIMVNLKQAIETVENFAEVVGGEELKKASLQLSVVAGLNSKDMKDGFTSGVPNSHLAACGHLYLSIVCKIQKKDKASAKHLLQVFCDSPFQARTLLLPDLWDHLFLPHLAHLGAWYEQEAESIPNTSSRVRKMDLLDKVYNEILDNGTYQFAVYYKEWLTDEIEAPSIPFIHIPTVSVERISPEASGMDSPGPESSLTHSLSSQPLISKRLYETVFAHTDKLGGSDGVSDGDGDEVFTACARSCDCAIEEDESLRAELSMKPQLQPETTNDATTDQSREKSGPSLTSVNEFGLHSVAEVKELTVEEDDKEHFQNTTMLHLLSHAKANELTLKKLAKAVFQLEQTEESPVTRACNGQGRQYDYLDENSFFSRVPKDFICPLTGRLFEDPVTLETGHSFDRAAIQEWFNQGNETCPLTGKRLEYLAVPITNFVLKRVIDTWKSEHCKTLLVYASQIADSSKEQGYKCKNEASVFILKQLLTGFRSEETIENAKRLISLGGLQFLIRRFELGNLEERTSVAALLSCCIKAEGSCRNDVARSINKSCLVELLHNKQIQSRTNAVLLLIELICLNRRNAIISFLSGMQKEGIVNTLHVLLVHLQNSPPEQRPLISVLLLHVDLLEEPRNYSIYRDEAVHALIVALGSSLTEEKARGQTSRALLILGGHFSSSGDLLIETWLLKQAGFYDRCDASCSENDDKVIQIDEMTPWQEEDRARDEWLQNLAVLLLDCGKKSLLETISKCLKSQYPVLVGSCLTTLAWLSRALIQMPDAEFQLSAFSLLVPRLKECLENDRVEHRVLASMTLLSFSEIPECRMLLSTSQEELAIPLSNLIDATWTAKELLSIISGDC